MYLQHQVKEIRFSNKGFYGISNYYSQDIAVLILDGKIERSPALMPACVHWERREKNYSPDDRLGKVIAFYFQSSISKCVLVCLSENYFSWDVEYSNLDLISDFWMGFE